MPANPRGYWESEALQKFHDELLVSAGSQWDDWRPFRSEWFDTPLAEDFKVRAKILLKEEFGRAPAFVFKDPRVCRFARFWLEVFAEEGIDAKIVLPLRSPLEVAHSLRTREGFSLQKGLLLWLRHVVDAEAASRDWPRGLFEWNALLQDWRAVTTRLEGALETRWPAMSDFSAIEVDLFLTPDLKHETISDAELAMHPQLHTWVADAYKALLELARNPASNRARATLDTIKDRFDDAARFFGGAMAEIELAYTQSEAMLRLEREAAARAKDDFRQQLDVVSAREQQAQAALLALQDQNAAQAQEVERLTALVDATRTSGEMMEAGIRAELSGALDAERQARAAEAQAYAAALSEMEAERNAKSEEVARLSELIDATRIGAEEALAVVRRELETLLESERQVRSAEAIAHTAALQAIVVERDAQQREIGRLAGMIDKVSAEAEEARARLTRNLEQAALDADRSAQESAEAVANFEHQLSHLQNELRERDEQFKAAHLRARTFEDKIVRLKRQPLRSIVRWLSGQGV